MSISLFAYITVIPHDHPLASQMTLNPGAVRVRMEHHSAVSTGQETHQGRSRHQHAFNLSAKEGTPPQIHVRQTMHLTCIPLNAQIWRLD